MQTSILRVIVILFIFSRGILFSYENYNATLFNINPISYGAALSGALATSAHGYQALFYNPALLVKGNKNELNFSHMFWLGRTYVNNFSGKIEISQELSVGISFFSFGSGDIMQTVDANSSLSRTSSGLWTAGSGSMISADNFAFSVGGAYDLKRNRFHLYTGIVLKISKADISGIPLRAFLMDIGVMFPLSEYIEQLQKKFPYFIPKNISLVVQNIGFGKSSFDTATARFSKAELVTGAGFEALTYKKYSLSYEFDVSTREGFYMGSKSSFDIYKYIDVDGLLGMRFINKKPSVSFGMNINLELKGFEYDLTYSFSTLSELGATHNIAFTFKSDYDFIYKIFGNSGNSIVRKKMLLEAQRLMNEGKYKEVYVLLKVLLDKNPNDKYIRSVFERLEEIMESNDLFFF